ncbi:unnamed protein product [Vitrella brassicaformis CCMP3155]|uniref:Uncharacterized protein n=1 Tax=Vitrella brassicaformis (strain CCMP3155) TaxID=1169540 RepID=A0A0G4F1M9_VITBC|nr:unnamed protein product [Vitrella brassicaformis CCMP3155]|eukprot:CEM05634.1 unnamed protein product [Vitrella brassicaformis CCMP3155]
MAPPTSFYQGGTKVVQVFVANLSRLRQLRVTEVVERIAEYIREHSALQGSGIHTDEATSLPFSVISNKWGMVRLDETWNVLRAGYRNTTLSPDARVLHYTGPWKPFWNANNADSWMWYYKEDCCLCCPRLHRTRSYGGTDKYEGEGDVTNVEEDEDESEMDNEDVPEEREASRGGGGVADDDDDVSSMSALRRKLGQRSEWLL